MHIEILNTTLQHEFGYVNYVIFIFLPRPKSFLKYRPLGPNWKEIYPKDRFI